MVQTPRFMLDTNICIYIRQKKSPQVAAAAAKLKPGVAVMSVVTYGELRVWVERHAQRERALEQITELKRLAAVLPLSPEVGEEYAAIRAHLQARGEVIGSNDLWIAAHAKAEGLTLVTNNENEFKRVPGLKVQNWAKP